MNAFRLPVKMSSKKYFKTIIDGFGKADVLGLGSMYYYGTPPNLAIGFSCSIFVYLLPKLRPINSWEKREREKLTDTRHDSHHTTGRNRI